MGNSITDDKKDEGANKRDDRNSADWVYPITMSEPNPMVPAKFYKYRSMADDSAGWVERTVLHDEIYFSPASKLNDPFELRPSFSLDASPDEQRKDFVRMSRKFDPHLAERERSDEADRVVAASLAEGEIGNTERIIQAMHAQAIIAQVGLYCVSTKCDDILMWAHYADSHRGICLEFDGMSPLMAHAQEVSYVDDRVPINPYKDSQDVMMSKALLTKSRHWRYESEWRLCSYERGPGLASFRPQNLTGIVIGAMASRATIDAVQQWQQQRRKPLNIYRAFISPNKFELNIKPYVAKFVRKVPI